MGDHVTEWLGAYHDGELRGAGLREVEQHLAECPQCQAELDEIRNLSALLQDNGIHGEFLNTERFVANLALRLPRQSEPPQPRSALKVGWWLVPVGLLGAWLFIDITLALSTVVAIVANSGLLNGHLAWLQGNPLQMEWFAATMNLFGNQLGAPAQETLSVLNEANLITAQLAGKLFPQVLLAISYLGWLLSWWLRQQSQRAESFS